MLSEKEIIDVINNIHFIDEYEWYLASHENATREECLELVKKAFLELPLIYIKQKEKIKELEEYSNWHIEHLTEDIADFIEDDRRGNASLIGELKEEREYWLDIKRIIRNEKTYIDYKNY